jgi:uncharacterized membrane protein YfcA
MIIGVQIEYNMFIFLFVILGMISGLLGGLVGIGGGIVTVPALYYSFLYMGMGEEKVMLAAVSTSLAAGFVNSALATYFHHLNRAILPSVLKMTIPGLLVGCITGALAAHYISNTLLRGIFGFVAFILAVYFFFPRLPRLHISHSPNKTLSLFGLLIGSLSSMLGIGGGALAFPVFLGYQVPIRNAAASSAVATLTTTAFGTLIYLIFNWSQPNIPAFLAISLGSTITSRFGVKLSHTLDVIHIKRIFACCLALIALSMLFI